MTVAATSAAPELRAAAKKARLDRTQARVAAVQTAQAQTKAMPPPPAPGAQARAGRAKPKADAARIKKKPKKAAAQPASTDAEERPGSETGSAAPSRAGNAKVGTTPPTTAQCSIALSAHTCTPQTTSNLTCNLTALITHHHSYPWTPLGFTDPAIKLELATCQLETQSWGLYLQPPEQTIPNPLEGWRSLC